MESSLLMSSTYLTQEHLFKVKLLTEVKVIKYTYNSEHLRTAGRGYLIPD